MLRISHSEIAPGVILMKLTGRIMLGKDSAPIPDLVQEWLKEGKRAVIVDLSEATHIDSTGIGRFIASYNAVTRAGAKLVMAGAAGQVRDGFHITRLDTVFRFYASVGDAQAAVS